MSREDARLIRRILQAADVVLLVVALLVAQRTLPHYRSFLVPGPVTAPVLSELVWLLIAALAIWPPLLSWFDLHAVEGQRIGSLLGRLARAAVGALGAVAVLIFVLKMSGASRLLVLAFVGLSALLLGGARCLVVWIAQWRTRHGRGGAAVLLVGTGMMAHEVARRVRDHSGGPVRLIGALAEGDEGARPAEVGGVPVLGGAEDFARIVAERPVDGVIVACEGTTSAIAAAIRRAEEIGLPLYLAPSYPALAGRGDDPCRFEHMLDLSVVSLTATVQDPVSLLLKRVLDVGLSAVLLVVLSPVFAVSALAVRLSSPGPIFYPWRVIGRNNRRFVGYKFRTMVVNADELRPALEARNEMAGPCFKMSDDPRITRVGRVLRKFSIDELPQLWSVLKGDMSLVGPRPPSPSEWDRFEYWQRRKLSVKPGMTCLWQVNGRHRIGDFREWVRLDLEYVDRWSLWLDLKILLRTVPAVVRGTGV